MRLAAPRKMRPSGPPTVCRADYVRCLRVIFWSELTDQHMVGLAGFVRHEGRKLRHKGDIWGVYVTAAARGQGMAKAMLLHMLDRLRGYSGLEQVGLSVSVPQDAARRLYDVLGFEVYGYEKHALKVGGTYVDEEHRVLWLRASPTAS